MVEKVISKIAEVTDTVESFFKKLLRKPDSQVVKTSKIDKGWEARVEVVEESEHMKAIGKRVMEKHLYDVVLDEDLNITSYDRHERAA